MRLNKVIAPIKTHNATTLILLILMAYFVAVDICFIFSKVKTFFMFYLYRFLTYIRNDFNKLQSNIIVR